MSAEDDTTDSSDLTCREKVELIDIKGEAKMETVPATENPVVLATTGLLQLAGDTCLIKFTSEDAKETARVLRMVLESVEKALSRFDPIVTCLRHFIDHCLPKIVYR